VPIQPLADDTPDGWPAVLQATPLLLLFKHSPLCGASGVSHDRVTDFADAHPDLPIFLIDVIAQRELSGRIAAALGVGHESPQVILIRDGQPVWNRSHFRITRDALETAVARARTAGRPPPA